MITMKLTIEVNCTVARTSKTKPSWHVNRRLGSVEGMKNPSVELRIGLKWLFSGCRRRPTSQAQPAAFGRNESCSSRDDQTDSRTARQRSQHGTR